MIAQYGEERFARRIAHAIVAARPLRTTRELADVVRDAIPAATRRRGPHPARRTFQAIRMEVNRELPNLADGLDDSVHVVGPSTAGCSCSRTTRSRTAWSRRRFRRWADDDAGRPVPPKLPVAPARRARWCGCLTRRPLRPRAEEVAANPRAESARLRAVERLALVPGTPDLPDIVA